MVTLTMMKDKIVSKNSQEVPRSDGTSGYKKKFETANFFNS